MARHNIFKVALKSYTLLLLFDVYIKKISMTNHKMVVTNIGQYIAQVFSTDETIDSAETKKGTSVATPVTRVCHLINTLLANPVVVTH